MQDQAFILYGHENAALLAMSKVHAIYFTLSGDLKMIVINNVFSYL